MELFTVHCSLFNDVLIPHLQIPPSRNCPQSEFLAHFPDAREAGAKGANSRMPPPPFYPTDWIISSPVHKLQTPD